MERERGYPMLTTGLGVAGSWMQNQLAHAVIPVTYLIQHQDNNVVREALAVLVMLLADGNKKAQR